MTFHRKGVDYNGPPKQCMVVGCERTAIYVNASSYICRKTGRGYCAKHKQYARPTGKTFEDSTAEYYKWNDPDKESK